MLSPLPVTVLASVDPVLRDSTAFTAVADVPGTVVVTHDLAEADGRGTMRRVVADVTGIVEDVTIPLDHSCLGCALREDVLPTLVRVAEAGRWQAVLLALPVGGEPLPVLHGLVGGVVNSLPVPRLVQPAGTVAVTDAATVVDDLFGDELLAERGLAHAEDDRRAVGEVLAHQLETADLVLVEGGPGDGRVARLLRHLVPPEAGLAAGPHEISGAHLLSWRRDAEAAWRRSDPLRVAPTGAPDGDGVWTRDLVSWRPLHPGRLRDHIEELGAGAVRGRGRFWLPGRPDTLAGWDGAGGQLSIGSLADWGDAERSTRLVLTGLEEAKADRVVRIFEQILLTDAELARGRGWWTARDDGFDPWLGERSAAA